MTFRWRKLADGRWAGVDGENWWIVDVSGAHPHPSGPALRSGPQALPHRGGGELGRERGLEVLSNASAAEFGAFFRLSENLGDVKDRIRAAAPELEDCLKGIVGLRVLRTSPEETFFTFLCTPNNHAERIGRMVWALERYGEPMEAPFEAFRFPSAERVAAIPEEVLRAQGFGYRGRTIPVAARELLERGPGWIEELAAGTYLEAHAGLCRISGIGPKLADCICLFGLGFGEAVPVDTHLWQAACRTYFPEWSGRSLTELRYREIGDLFRSKFGELAGWAHQYLFCESFMARRDRGK